MVVRREKVILDLEDRFSNPTLRAAAAAKTLDKSLGDADRSVVRTDRNLGSLSRSATRADRDINKLSGRIRLFADLAATLGPALVPIGAMAIPALAGLAAQFGAAALAGGTALIAFQGVGDALEAVNEAALEPTTENLQAAREALEQISPAARDFVREFQAMRPVFDGLSDAAGEGLFPGLTSALIRFEGVAPRVETALTAIGGATGEIVDDFANGLTGPRGVEFLEFIRTEVPSALAELGATMGNFSAGLAEMWMAFTPLNQDFSNWLLDASESFDRWAQGLSQTEGFENFIDYIRENGPLVGEALGAIGNALVNIVTAAAPLGGPTLMALEAIADVIGTIAGSDMGPPILAAVSAMTLLSRSTRAYGRVAQTAWAQGLSGAKGLVGITSSLTRATSTMAAGVGLIALSMTDLDEKAGLSNAAMGALVGTMIAPGVGSAIGGLVGLFADFAAANDNLVDALNEADSAINSLDVDRIKASIAEVNTEFAAQEAYISGLGLSMTGLGGAYEKVFGQGDEARDTQRRLNVALAAAEGRTTDLGASTLQVAAAANRYVNAAKRQAAALQESRSAARETGNEFITLGDKLDDAKQSLGQWLKQLENQADALRNFRKNAVEAAEKGLRQGLIAALQEAGPAGALRMRQLANATEAEIGRANKAWGEGQKQIRKYTDEVGGVPTSATTKVNADTAAALNDIGSVAARIQALDGQSATVTVNYQTTGRAVSPDGPFRPGLADGGSVPKTGRRYADRHLYLLADGEEVTSNRSGQADRYRSALKAINAGMSRESIRAALADGGTARGERHALGWGGVGGGGTRVIERVVERLPDNIRVYAPGLGEVVLQVSQDVARSEIADDKRHERRQNARV